MCSTTKATPWRDLESLTTISRFTIARSGALLWPLTISSPRSAHLARKRRTRPRRIGSTSAHRSEFYRDVLYQCDVSSDRRWIDAAHARAGQLAPGRARPSLLVGLEVPRPTRRLARFLRRRGAPQGEPGAGQRQPCPEYQVDRGVHAYAGHKAEVTEDV